MTTTYLSGPWDIQTGNSASFALEFISSVGSITVPTSATLTVAYTNTSNTTQSDSVTLSLSGSFWTGTWSSTSAALGLATFTAASNGSTATASGQLRIIQRQSTY